MTISGPPNLIVGQVVQLTATATFNNGQTQPIGSGTGSGVSWQSSSQAVATVTIAGVLTGLANGTATISVTYAGKTGTFAISVSATGQIASCGSYTGSAIFVATVTLTSPSLSVSCLSFSNAVAAQLDCQGHDVSSIVLSNVQGFAIKNCLMHLGAGVSLRVLSSSHVSVTSDDVLGQVYVNACQGCTFTNNTFVFPAAACTPGQNSLAPGELLLFGGQSNTVSNNTIDAGWDGAFSSNPPSIGCDDVVLIESEANSRIQGNVIRNAYDAGIEGVNSITIPITTTIQGNTISHVGFTGIGGYYVCGWQNSLFSGNTVSNSPSLLYFVHDSPSGSPGPTAMTLVSNQIVGNTFMNPTNPAPQYGAGIPAAMTIDYVTGGLPYTVTGNLIQNNNFGTASGGPILAPAQGFVDGGGNICSAGTILTCGGGAGDVHGGFDQFSRWAFTRVPRN